jgi:hypothetical protein
LLSSFAAALLQEALVARSYNREIVLSVFTGRWFDLLVQVSRRVLCCEAAAAEHSGNHTSTHCSLAVYSKALFEPCKAMFEPDTATH